MEGSKRNDVFTRDQIVEIYAKFVRENKALADRWQEKFRREQQLKEEAPARAKRAEDRLMELEKSLIADGAKKMQEALEKAERDELMRFEFEEVRLAQISIAMIKIIYFSTVEIQYCILLHGE